MTLKANLELFAAAVGTDIRGLLLSRGVLANLTTTQKDNLVAAINELKAGLDGVDSQVTGLIDDAAVDGTLDKTYSADKILDLIAALKAEIIGGAPSAYDTLLEISNYLAANDTELDALLTAINNRVRFDAAQTLTTAQQIQACENIGVGDPTVDLVAAYTTARDAV